jgi:CIC family chloride channel protein
MWQEYRFHLLVILAAVNGSLVGVLISAWTQIIPFLTSQLIALPVPPLMGYLLPLSLSALLMGRILLLAPRTGGPGITDAIEIIFTEREGDKWYWMPLKWMGTLICITTGGGGLVGPSVFIGTTNGILLGKRVQLHDHERQLLALTGIAGGVAAVLKAPIGGIAVMVEAITRYHGKQKTRIWSIIVISSVTCFSSYLTVGMLIGFSPILSINSEVPQLLSSNILWSILGGIASGLVAKIFISSFQTINRLFNQVRCPISLKPLIGALLASGIVIIFSTGHTSAPQPFEIGRIGLAPLLDAMEGKLSISILGMLILGKSMDVAIRSGSGNSVGVFGPAIWIGGLTGALIGIISTCNHSIGPIVSGIAAGITTAMGFPLAATLIVFEIFGLGWIGNGILGSLTGMFVQWIWKKYRFTSHYS